MKPRMLPVLIAAAAVIGGCMSARNHPALEAVQKGQEGQGASGPTYVEAYIEYPGPQQKWAGPESFVLHVMAKEGKMAELTATPDWFNKTTVKLASRRLASALSEAAKGAEAAKQQPGLSNFAVPKDVAREKLRYLAGAIQNGPEPVFKGCLSPVRVRLVREDGQFLEKTGCRSETGWPHVASESVEYFMTAMLYGSESSDSLRR